MCYTAEQQEEFDKAGNADFNVNIPNLYGIYTYMLEVNMSLTELQNMEYLLAELLVRNEGDKN
jgi:hypothetical protein